MADYEAGVPFDLREEPIFGAKRLEPRVEAGATVVIGDASAAGFGAKWLTVTEVDGTPRQGWANIDWLQPLDNAGGPMTDAERDVFCGRVTSAARNNRVDRDYLMAVAFAESGINNIRSKSSSAFGPFQFTKATWDDLVKEVGAETGITRAMRFEWPQQPTMAAILTRRLEEALVDALSVTPRLGQLYFGHVFGRSGARRLLTQPPGRPFLKAYEEAFPGKSASVARGNPFVQSKTIEEVLAELGRRLDEGFDGAAPIIDRQPAEIRFVHAAPDGPPWLRVAREELARGVRGIPGPKSERRIEEYHAIAGGADSTDDVPWCGSFVTFCLKTCGHQVAATSVVGSPRRAESWKNWAEVAPTPTPVGAVIVLRPQTANSSGHVGFFVGEDETHVTLLGGNQSAAVNETRYHAKREVVARRWLAL